MEQIMTITTTTDTTSTITAATAPIHGTETTTTTTALQQHSNICQGCGVDFPSRSAVFRHLN
jgi:hypothetical protein